MNITGISCFLAPPTHAKAVLKELRSIGWKKTPFQVSAHARTHTRVHTNTHSSNKCCITAFVERGAFSPHQAYLGQVFLDRSDIRACTRAMQISLEADAIMRGGSGSKQNHVAPLIPLSATDIGAPRSSAIASAEGIVALSPTPSALLNKYLSEGV